MLRKLTKGIEAVDSSDSLGPLRLFLVRHRHRYLTDVHSFQSFSIFNFI